MPNFSKIKDATKKCQKRCELTCNVPTRCYSFVENQIIGIIKRKERGGVRKTDRYHVDNCQTFWKFLKQLQNRYLLPKHVKCKPIIAFFRSVSASFSTTFCFSLTIRSFVFSDSLLHMK